MTRILILLVAGSALTLLPGDAPAGCHAVQIKKQAVVAYAPVYNAPYVYQVGQGLQLRAAIELAKEELRAEMRAMQLSSPGNSESSPERLPITASGDPYSLVNKYCVGCHSTNAKASEAFDMSSLASLTCDERIVAINAVLDGRMPKGTKIPQELIGDLLGQLSQADTAPNANARVAAPVREEIEATPPPEPQPTGINGPPWKFKEGDEPYVLSGGYKSKIIDRHRMISQTGKVENYYSVLYETHETVKDTIPERGLAWKRYGDDSEAEVTWLPASEVPPPRSVIQAPADPFVDSLRP